MRGPSAEAAPGSGAPRGGWGRAAARPPAEWSGARPRRGAQAQLRVWALRGPALRLAACLDPRRGRRGREVGPRALGPAANPGRYRRGAPGPPSRRCLPGRLRSAGAGASAAAGGEQRAEAWARGRPEGGKEEGGEKGWEGGTRQRRRREGARQRAEGGSERGRQAGREGGRARGRRRRRREQRTSRDAAPRHQGAQPGRPDPTGHTVMSAAAGGPGGRPGGGRGGGEAGRGARRRAVPGSGHAPGPLQLGAGRSRGQGCGRGRRAGLARAARGI